MKVPIRERKNEAGQAILLVIVAMSIFLLAAVGLAIDGSHLYAERQMAQAAADAGAQAGAMTVFDGTNGMGTHTAGTAFNCGASDSASPCQYAQTLNRFNLAGDTVAVSFPTSAPSLPTCSSTVAPPCLSSTDPVNLVKVTVSRQVPTTLMGLLSSATPTISAVGVAGIVDVISPIPIIVTHPTMANALDANGNTGITITGGPQRSIQINSSGTSPAGAAYNPPSSGNVDLRGAGPNGTGGDFGTFGGPSTNPGHTLVGTGRYIAPSSPVQDPLAGVAAPSVPTGTAPPLNGQSCSILGHCGSCPAPGFAGAPPATCTEYLPGAYTKLDLTGVNSAFFDPGIYYIKGGGFTLKNDTVGMCTTCAADPTTKDGMLIYDAGSTPTSTATGRFTVDTQAYMNLLGAGVSRANTASAPVAPYYGILFFEQRNADAHTGNGANGAHNLGQGNGCFTVIGTIYITNTLAIMKADQTHYQGVNYHGTPCSSTNIEGEIIVSQLTIKGTTGLSMSLFPQGFLAVRQVALIQ